MAIAYEAPFPRLFAVTWLAAIATLAVACSGESKEGPDQPDPTEPGTDALIEELCDQMAALPCDPPPSKQACLQNGQQEQAVAEQEGCEAQLDEYLSCATSYPVECQLNSEVGSHPAVSYECSSLHDAFVECYTGLSVMCAVGFCKIMCPELSSSCEGSDPNGPVECVCDTGPRAGATFQATDCGQNLAWATGHNCT